MICRISSVGLLWLCFATLPAHAGYRVCASDQLKSADSRAVRKVVSHTAGQREILWSSMSACVNRRSARAWLDLKAEPQSDGSLVEFTVSCERETGSWSCRLAQSRSARMELMLDGHAKTFEITLPSGFDLQRAKLLLLRAHEVASTMKVQQMCDYREEAPSDSRVEEWLRSSQHTFRFFGPRTSGSIADENGLVSLDIGNEVLEFVPDPNDATELEFRCWTFYIVVT